MTQRQLERAVADATGESLRTIHQRGFHVVRVKQHDQQDPQVSLLAVTDSERVSQRNFVPAGLRSSDVA